MTDKVKEGIVRRLCDGWVGGMTPGDEQRIVYPAMDEYSEILACEFSEWIKKWYSISKGGYRHRGDFYKNDKKLKTIKELFQLFIQSKQ